MEAFIHSLVHRNAKPSFFVALNVHFRDFKNGSRRVMAKYYIIMAVKYLAVHGYANLI